MTRCFFRRTTLVVTAWLLFPAAGRSEPPPAGLDPASLVRALDNPAEQVRFQAMAELMRIGRPATRELAQALVDVQPTLPMQPKRSELAFAVLSHVSDLDVDALLEAYRSAPPEPIAPPEKSEEAPVPARRRIRMVLERVAAKPTERIHDAFRSEDPALRASLAGVMGRAGSEAAGAVPVLAQAVAEDREAKVRAAAAYALGRIPESGPQALRGLLGHTDPRIRAAALAAYPANAAGSGELVALSLKDPVQEVRQTALKRLWRPGLPVESDFVSVDPLNPCRSAGSEEPAPALLAGLPGSALPDVVALARDENARRRWTVIQALGSLACARQDLAPAIAGTLAEKLSDPAIEVATASLDQIFGLAERNLVPGSPEILEKLLEKLADPSRNTPHGVILQILERMDLPEARRNETIDVLVTVCLSEGWTCERVHAILSRRPGWLKSAGEAVAVRHSDPRSFDDETLEALEDLGGGRIPVSTELLERLLDHPEQPLRVRAARELAGRGYNSGRLRGVLMEGVRTSDNFLLGDETAKALAQLGEPGVAGLIGVLRDSEISPSARASSIHVLSQVATGSPQAADYLLKTAVSAEDPDAQTAAILGLAPLKSRPAAVRTTLEQAFLTGDAEARSAVVQTWKEAGQAPVPGNLIERVAADPDPLVRRGVFSLLSLLPGDDPRRLTLTAAALEDQEKVVREAALMFAGALGEPGAALLARYVADGGPLTAPFFHGARRLDQVGDALAGALEARAAKAPAWELDEILSILGDAGAEAPRERNRLYDLLDTADPNTRELAAEGLLTLREDPWTRDGRLAAALTETGVRRIVQRRLNTALKQLHLYQEGPRPESVRTPRFPWPPPPGYRPLEVVPRELFGTTRNMTLGDIHKQLVSALLSVSHGFERGVFLGPPGGFALVARRERIESDGTPFPEPARWLEEGSPKFDLIDFFADLFFEDPGYFRIIVFAVTSDLVPGHDPRAVLPGPGDGAPKLPDEVARQPFEGKEVLALVYSFEKRPDSKAIKPWGDGAPSALQHLEKAGVWSRFGRKTS